MGDMETEVKHDIRKCSEILESQNTYEAKKIVDILISAYGDYIAGIKADLDQYKVHYNTPVDYLGDIAKLKRKLELFLANECVFIKNRRADESKVLINNSNYNSNSNVNKNEINLSLLFDQLRNDIKNDEHLSQEETDDVLNKVNEIQEISNSVGTKKEKWLKLRRLFQWLSTKGVDIGLKILPVITEILKKDKG